MVRLQFDNNKQYKITLPKALVEAKGWSKGSKIKIELSPTGDLVLKLAEVSQTQPLTGPKGGEK